MNSNDLPAMPDSLNPEDLTDRTLLSRFLENRSEEAFKAIMRKHGPMVFRSCYRVLRNWTAAEDATQETFILLAQKAAQIGKRKIVGGWLYRSSVFIAQNHLRAMKRREQHESEASKLPENSDQTTWDELAPDLDLALASLNEKLGNTITLCYLQGYSQREAAKELGCSEGAISKRLNKALAKLQSIFRSRGIQLSIAGLAYALSDGSKLQAVEFDLDQFLNASDLCGRALCGEPIAGGVSSVWIKPSIIGIASIATISIGISLIWNWAPPAVTPERHNIVSREARDEAATSDTAAIPYFEIPDGVTIETVAEKTTKASMSENAELASQLLSELGITMTGEELLSGSDKALKRWTNLRPEEAAAYAIQFNEEGRSFLAFKVFGAWCESDPAAALHFLESFSPELPDYKILHAFVRDSRSPLKILERIEESPDDPMLRVQLEKVARLWPKDEYESLLNWYNSSNLPIDAKRLFLKGWLPLLVETDPETSFRLLSEFDKDDEEQAKGRLKQITAIAKNFPEQAKAIFANESSESREKIAKSIAEGLCSENPAETLKWLNTLEGKEFEKAYAGVISASPKELMREVLSISQQDPSLKVSALNGLLSKAVKKSDVDTTLQGLSLLLEWHPDMFAEAIEPNSSRQKGNTDNESQEAAEKLSNFVHKLHLFKVYTSLVVSYSLQHEYLKAIDWIDSLGIANSKDRDELKAIVLAYWSFFYPHEAQEWLNQTGLDPSTRKACKARIKKTGIIAYQTKDGLNVKFNTNGKALIRPVTADSIATIINGRKVTLEDVFTALIKATLQGDAALGAEYLSEVGIELNPDESQKIDIEGEKPEKFLELWTRLDPKAATDFAIRFNHEGYSWMAFDTIGYWSHIDNQAAVKYVESLPRDLPDYEHLLEWVHDAPHPLRVAKKFEKDPDNYILRYQAFKIVSRLPEEHMKEGISWLLRSKLPTETKHEILRKWLPKIASWKPATAFKIAMEKLGKTKEDQQTKRKIIELVAELDGRFPDYLYPRTKDKDRPMVAERIAKGIAVRDFKEALRWIENLDEKSYPRAYSSVISKADEASLFALLEKTSENSLLFRHAVNGLTAHSDNELSIKGFEYLSKLNPEITETLYSSKFYLILDGINDPAKLDPDQLESFLDNMTFQNFFLKIAFRFAVKQEFEEGITWALGIQFSDAKIKGLLISTIVGVWHFFYPEEARTWLNETRLSDDLREDCEKAIRRSGVEISIDTTGIHGEFTAGTIK